MPNKVDDSQVILSPSEWVDFLEAAKSLSDREPVSVSICGSLLHVCQVTTTEIVIGGKQ